MPRDLQSILSTKPPKWALVVGGLVVLVIVGATAYAVMTNKPYEVKNNVVNVGNSADSTSDVPEADQELKGIIVAECTGVSTWTLTAYDPSTSKSHSRTFNAGERFPMYRCLQSRNTIPAWALSQMFDSTFSKLAVQTPAATDGRARIGYINVDGDFTDLTPSQSSYSNINNNDFPLFNPGTGRIWYRSGSTFGSVDPGKGKTSARTEQFSTTEHLYYFTPDGKTPLDSLTDAYRVFSEDGKLEVQRVPLEGYKIGTPGTLGASSPIVPVKDCAFQDRFFTNSSFFCVNQLGNQIFIANVSNRAVSFTKPLLPQSDRGAANAVGSPDKKQVAFVSGTGQQLSLYVVSASGGEPKKIADIGNGANGGTPNINILTWR